MAGGSRVDLEKVAREQQMKNREEIERILASVKAKHGEGQLRDGTTTTTGGSDGEISAITGSGKSNGAGKNKTRGSGGNSKCRNLKGDGSVTTLEDVAEEEDLKVDGPKKKKHSRSGQADFDKVTGKVDLCLMHSHHQQ